MRRFAILSALLLAHVLGAAPRTTPLADTARFLAGLEPAPGSPLARFRKHDAWLHFRQSIGKKWAHYDKVCTAEIRKWTAVWMPDSCCLTPARAVLNRCAAGLAVVSRPLNAITRTPMVAASPPRAGPA